MYKKNIILVIGLLLVLFLFCGCVKDKQAEPVSLGDEPMVAYMRLEVLNDDGAIYSLKVSSYDGDSQSIATKGVGLGAGSNGDIIGYGLKTESALNKDIYLLDRNGESQLIAEDIALFEMCEKKSKILCIPPTQFRTFIIKEFTSDGDLIEEETIEGGEDVHSWTFSSNWEILLLQMKRNEDEDTESDIDWRDIYIYKDGQMTKVVEKGFASQFDQTVSNNGEFIYLADGVLNEDEVVVGTLYRKKLDGDAEIVIEDCTWHNSISNDGALISAIIKDEIGNDTLYYQYDGEEPVIIKNVVQYEMCRDDKTLYYTVGDKTDWKLEMYRVVEGKAPVLVTDNAAKIVDITEDGKTVAFVANYDSEIGRAEIYIAIEGRQIEFVDSDIITSEFEEKMVTSEVKLYYDGTAIAYLKGEHDDYGQFRDLYVKEQGKEPVKIDEQVASDFEFLK